MNTVQKPALKDQAYDAIKRMILFGELRPGQLINESDLQERIAIGRTPVREALLQLAQDMLVVIHPRKGIEVATVTPKKINEIFEVRLLLEVGMLQKHMGRLDRNWLISLKEDFLALSQLESLDQEGIRRAIEMDGAFHRGMLKASGNGMAENIMEGFLDYLMLLWATTTADQVRHMASEREHIQIIETILSGDVDDACRSLQEHLEISWKATLDSYVQGG